MLFYRELKNRENVTERSAIHQKLASRIGEKWSDKSPVHSESFVLGYRALKIRVGWFIEKKKTG